MKRIVITGPESTGKSWITEKLAQHYQVPWVREFARSYLDDLNRAYQFEDLLNIAKGQKAWEQRVGKESPCYFCDTDLLVIKIWSQYKYQKVDPWIVEQLQQTPCDLYLLMTADLPWQPDPQREHPHQREALFELYEKELKKLGHNYVKIYGTGDQRLANAIEHIGDLCK